MSSVAAKWVQSQCIDPALTRKAMHFLDACIDAGLDCSVLIGGALTRSGFPSLVHRFSEELFVFELTEQQAAALGVDPYSVIYGQGREPLQPRKCETGNAIILNRLALAQTTLTETTQIAGRLHFEVVTDQPGDWCVRLDYLLGKEYSVTWFRPFKPIWGNETSDFLISPETFGTGSANRFKGPVVLFARIFETEPREKPEWRRPLSNAIATLVDVV